MFSCWTRANFLYFYANFFSVKRLGTVIILSCFSSELFAQNEIGPDGGKLIWLLLIVLALVILFVVLGGIGKKGRINFGSILRREHVRIDLKKDRLYYPDNISLTVKNTGNADIDLDRPLLIFDNFWLKRNFRINGMNNRTFYPLYLEKGKTHILEIDLNRFYRHDKRLKRYPKIKIRLSNVKGKKLGHQSLYLRKTLFKF